MSPEVANNSQITCLFWFESSFTLHRVEESKIVPMPTTPLVSEAIPTMGFRKWVTTILSTTQVTQNVILLALMFIYRLKKLNPTVKGKPGSEFRLLTVALMLGNKCKHTLNLSRNGLDSVTKWTQSSTIIRTRTKRGQRYRAFLYKKSISWRLSS